VDRREAGGILAAHDNQLNGPRASLRRLPRKEQVQGLLELAEHLQGILVPVQADANFRRRLHGELILKAQRRQAAPQAGLFRQHRKGILIGAAAVGSVVSVLGVVIAFVLRHRHGRATRIATG
jgi:hypothetical protein